MKTLGAVILGGSILAAASVLAFQQERKGERPAQAQAKAEADIMSQVAAETYEDLANAIIAIEKTEDNLVKSILLGYHAAAQNHLRAAARPNADRKMHLEAAATEIGNIANEGDKPIRAIRQRLAQAGHTHNTDAETKEDYMFITNREKQGLLELARKITQIGPDADPQEIRQAAASLAAAFEKAIAPE